jgi:ribosomal protein S18 acetylase RimI-like enzyme
VTVRRAVPGDEAVVRDVRLRALADAPGAFGSTLERERLRADADWARWLTRGATFLHERDGAVLGIACGVPHDDDPSIAFLMSMWVDANARGTGAGDALVVAVLAWAEAEVYAAVLLHVTDGNLPAQRLYERHGFRATGGSLVRKRDGAVEVEMRRELRKRR